MLEPGELPAHVFFRLADREPFSYAGIARAESVAKEKVPVEVRWVFDDGSQPRPERPPEEVVYLCSSISKTFGKYT